MSRMAAFSREETRYDYGAGPFSTGRTTASSSLKLPDYQKWTMPDTPFRAADLTY